MRCWLGWHKWGPWVPYTTRAPITPRITAGVLGLRRRCQRCFKSQIEII